MELRNLADPVNVLVVLVTLCVFVAPIFIIFPPVPVERSDALRQTHRKVGRPAALTTRRTTDRKTTTGSTDTAAVKSTGTVRKLCIYPVKSCGGIDIPKSKVLPTGLEHDRLYGFAQLRSPFPQSLDMPAAERDAHRWEFATQRQFPLLATVSAELWVPDATKKSRLLGGGAFAAEAFIVLRFPWQEAGFKGTMEWLAAKISRGWRGVAEKEILLPVAFPSDEEIQERGYEYDTVRVWKEDVRALNMARELPKELRLYLGVSNQLGLFRINPKERRDVFRAAPRKDEAGYQPIIDFHDAYPLHLLNLNSLEDMESKLKKDEDIQELDARRFRANIIVDGSPAYDEDSWKKVRFRPGPSSAASHCTFHVSCRTVRCKMPNVDQDTGFRHGVEPDSALRKFRDVDAGAPKKGCLGMQLCPLFEEAGRTSFLESWIHEGMELEVLERGDHFYIKQ